jgi:hypothetical protein
MLLQNNSINPPVIQDSLLIPQHHYSIRGATYLTPDALMNYCSTRLRGLDNQIQTKFEKQQTANHDSQVLSELQGNLNFGNDDLKVTGGTGVSTDCTIKGAAQALLEAANKVTDPGVQKRLIDLASKLVHVTGAPPSASFDANASVALKAQTYKPEEMTQMISQPVGNLQKDLNSGTELDMIQLQSLMSQRQTAVSTVTQMIQALGEQLNKIAGNIGH